MASKSESTAGGVFAGTVIGLAVGGPIGAAIGGVVGAAIGASGGGKVASKPSVPTQCPTCHNTGTHGYYYDPLIGRQRFCEDHDLPLRKG